MKKLLLHFIGYLLNSVDFSTSMLGVQGTSRLCFYLTLISPGIGLFSSVMSVLETDLWKQALPIVEMVTRMSKIE